MKQLIEFRSDDDSLIWIEVDEPEAEGGTERAGRFGDAVEKVKAKVTFDQALNQVCIGTEKVIKRLRSLSDRPDEIEIEFGFKMNSEIGASIAKISTEGNYKVTMRWQEKKQI